MATRGLLMTGILAKGHCTNLGLDCRKQIVTSKMEVHNFNQGERKSSYQLHIWYQEVKRWSKLFVKWKMNIFFTAEKPLPEVTIKYFGWSLEQKGHNKWSKRCDTHHPEQCLCSQHMVTKQSCLSNYPVNKHQEFSPEGLFYTLLFQNKHKKCTYSVKSFNMLKLVLQ